MVVARRVPTTPQVSRSTVPQGSPKKGKGRESSSNADSTADEQTDVATAPQASSKNHSETTPDSSASKGKQKGKTKKHNKASRRPKSTASAFLDLLVRALLLFFTIYSFTVCPDDEHLSKPICRGLAQYRRLILEPILIPAAEKAYSFVEPTVGPYVAKVEPYYTHAVQRAQPVLARTQAEWNGRVVPQWNKRIVPEWNKRVVPQWKKHVSPHIHRAEVAIAPYLNLVQDKYQTHGAPLVDTLQTYQHKARPYIVLAAKKTRDGYESAKPYAILVLEKLRELFKQFALFLQAKRREFVDPHVARMWDKVVELSTGKPPSPVSGIPMPKPGPPPDVVASPSSVVSQNTSPTSIQQDEGAPLSIVSSSAPVIASTASSYATDAVSTASESASSLGSVVSESAALASSTISEVAHVVSESASSVVSLVSESAVSASSVVSETGQAASAEAVVTSLLESMASSASAAIIPSNAADITGPSPVPPAPTAHAEASTSEEEADEEEADIDVDDFFAELGLDEEEPAPPPVLESTPTPEVHVETAEEREAREKKRAEDNAKRRADVMGRRAQWEDQLEEETRKQRKALRKALVALRKQAAAELTSVPLIREQIDLMEAEADKYLKGAEASLKKMKKDTKTVDKRPMWNKIIAKVEEKFETRMRETAAVVNSWYEAVLARENQEVWNAIAPVRDIVSRAQGDLGLDMAWLDDVTYQEWQRYHDLARTSERFEDQAFSIQNGTHPSPPINPVVKSIDELQVQLQDIILGFDTRIRMIKRAGERAFSSTVTDDDYDHDDDHPTSADPVYSILPVPDSNEGAKADDAPDVPPGVIIGKSKDQIMEALANFEESVEATHGSEEGTPELAPFDHVEL